jgi:hypothetical protein
MVKVQKRGFIKYNTPSSEPFRIEEELHNLCSSPDIITQVKSRRMRWAGHVARMGEERKVQGFGGKDRRKEITRKTKA